MAYMNRVESKIQRHRITPTWVNKSICLTLLALLMPGLGALAQPQSYVQFSPANGAFPIAQSKTSATMYVDLKDFPGVIRAAGDLKTDITHVTDCSPAVAHDSTRLASNTIIIGTIGKSALIDQLIHDHKIDVQSISGKWESFLIQVARNPMPNVNSALVIAGSDKRGTIFGIYDLSEQIGVSPWYWWADVPIPHRDSLFVKAGTYIQGPPAVKYRGIFLNDEAPALSGFVKEKFGNYNHQFYEHVFELLLRLKGNYLWPAMWNNAFNEDDPLSPKLADEYGIVMGTSHHEPMLRAQQEWKRHGTGAWNYDTNADVLRNFWSQGVERNKNYESIITIGMRGDGDKPMVAGGDMAANVKLLEQIVADQRKIIADKINPDVTRVPQDWALYKEVQEYYEKGMRVPDDVTLLWCDDNWGNIRRLPTPEERKRPGGAGIYYHFDYVGGPRSYKWINTIPIPKIWEQMNLAANYGADRIWIVNVGDLKPMELPIDFFLRMAWNPQSWPKEKLQQYTEQFAAEQFGPEHAAEIADILSKYTKYNYRRKPELLDLPTYSLTNYDEADSIVYDFKSIADKAEQISRELPEKYRDAFFELVLYPTKASEIVNELYVTAARNHLYATQGRAATNDLAAQTRALFQADADFSAAYNHLANGKWDHMMDQTHIGYSYWQEPRKNTLPQLDEIKVPAKSELAIAVEGSDQSWPGAKDAPTLAAFDVFNQPRRYVAVFNRGSLPFQFTATTSDPWIVLSDSHGTIEKEQRLWINVDWLNAPKGASHSSLKITRDGADSMSVNLNLFNPIEPSRDSLRGFVEADGYVSIEAEHYSRKIDTSSARWEKIPDLSRTLSSTSIFPVSAASVTPPKESPCLEYDLYLFTNPDKIQVEADVAPTLNFAPGRGLRFAVSFDDQPPQILDALEHNSLADWENSVRDSIRRISSTHTLSSSGHHILKVWMVDPGVVLQKLIVNLGGVKPSYLGPPESYHH
jgi:Glycosyl hydrolase family 115/Gylcosyl hydrolase family 115 C-terminal domain